jgi:hypothetical protein
VGSSRTAVIAAAAWSVEFIAEVPRKKAHPAFRGLSIFHHHVESHSIRTGACFIFAQIAGELGVVGKPAKRLNPPSPPDDPASFEQRRDDLHF